MSEELEVAIEGVLRRFRIPMQAPGEVEGDWDRGDLASDIAETVRAFGPLSDGAWIAHHEDWSEFRVFAREVDALRHAVDHNQRVRFVPWAANPRDFDPPPGAEPVAP